MKKVRNARFGFEGAEGKVLVKQENQAGQRRTDFLRERIS